MEGIVLRAVILLVQLVLLLMIFKRDKNNTGYFYKGISAGIIAYYTVFPLVIIVAYIFGSSFLQEQINGRNILHYIIYADYYKMIITSIMTIAFQLLFSLAYSSRIKFIFGKENYNSGIDREIKTTAQHTLVFIGNVMLLIGGFCTLYYMLSFGSISKAIRLSGYVRSFTVSSTRYVSYLASIMIIPAGAVVIAPWCFLLGLDYNGGSWKRVKFIISLVLSALFLLVKAGRAPLLIFLISFAMPFLIKRTKHPWLILSLAASIGMPIIDFLDAIFDNAIMASGYNFTGYIAQFAYPYRTITSIFEIIREYGIRWGQDFVTSFLGMIPGFNFDSTWRIISEYIGGTGWKTTGSTPTDLISFCLLEFHLFGILLGGILGLICRNLDKALFCIEDGANRSEYGIRALSSFCLLNCFWFVSTADFESLVRNIFFLGTCIVILLITKGKRKG